MFLGKHFCCRSELTFYAIPNEVRDPSALTCLGKTQWEAVAPNEVKDPSALMRLGKTQWEAVAPTEVKVASLTLGKTKEGLLGKTKEGLIGKTIKRTLGIGRTIKRTLGRTK